VSLEGGAFDARRLFTMLIVPRSAFVLAGALAAVALAACAVDTSSGGGERISESASALTANDKTAFDYFLAKGLTPIQAAGIVGNLDQESNMLPTAVQAGGPGRGIAQWSVGGRWNHDAGDNATSYAASHGKSLLSLGLQLDFIWFELTTFSGYGLAALKKSTTVSEATLAFMKDFEACGNCLSSQRITYANAALAAYGKDHVDAGSDATTSDAGTEGGPGTHGGTSGGTETEDAGESSQGPMGSSGANGDDPAADSGGCSLAHHGARADGAGAIWLASLCAALACVLARRRKRTT